MKHLLLTLCFVCSSSLASDDLVDKPDADFVKDVYQFCADYAASEESNEKDNIILECVNYDMESSGYPKFSSLADIKAAMS